MSSRPGRQRPLEWGSARVFRPAVLDLSDKIIRLSDHPTEAGSFADVYKCRYESNEGIKEVCVPSRHLNPARPYSSPGSRESTPVQVFSELPEKWPRQNKQGDWPAIWP